MDKELVNLATTHVQSIINDALELKENEHALIIYDTHNGLTNILTEAYRNVLPRAQFIDFDSLGKEEIIAAINAMHPSDLVVLIQSSNFLLDAFRIRLHLFQKKLKVIEHTHLYRNTPDVWDVYINALEYDKTWYRTIGPRLKKKLEETQTLQIEAGDAILRATGGLESPKLNIGDYSGMENIGGTFPIGEVFTENKDFSKMNGSLMIYAYAGGDFTIAMHTPFRVDVEEGMIVGWEEKTPPSFVEIIETIRKEERPLVREIGFGLNRAITRERYVQDITAFERILGMHLSLGEKHNIYKKEGITTHKTKFHVDVFPVVDRVIADGETIFENGKYVI